MSVRQERIRELIHTHLSSIFMLKVTDPALKDISITEVQVDREIEYADIYVNAMGDEARQEEVMKGLERAKGFLRRELASGLRLRREPVLHFHWDETLEAGIRMEKILDSLHIEKEKDESATELPGSES